MEKSSSRVCVTGGGGYLGSWLVRKLLKKGYDVNATLRNLGDESKTGLLKSFDGAEERLRLFEANIYDAESFKSAIHGCTCVFLVATPLQHYTDSQYKDTTEASVSAVEIIMKACARSKTVKRVIYTGTVFSASPWNEDGSGFKNSMDESSWTPLHLPIAFINERIDYVHSKTITEREFLSYNHSEEEGRKLEVVSLVCGVVGGDTLQSSMPASMAILVSPVTGEEVPYKQLQLLQRLLGSVPLLHVDDACEAHVFCMEKAFVSGRFLCAGACPTADQITGHFERRFPQYRVIKEEMGSRVEIPCSSTKLIDLGFKFNFKLEEVLDDSIKILASIGLLKGFHSRRPV